MIQSLQFTMSNLRFPIYEQIPISSDLTNYRLLRANVSSIAHSQMLIKATKGSA